MFSRESAHGSVGEAVTDRTAHNTEALDMFRYFREGRKEQSHVGQGSCCDNPGCTLRLGQEGIPHCENRILTGDGLFRGTR